MSPKATTPNDPRNEQFRYQRAQNEAPSEAVLSAVSEVSNRNVIPRSTDADGDSLEPLYHAIDPDALNALFTSSENDTDSSGSVTFTYCGYEVTVERTGTILVSDPSTHDGL
ncbi:HalOD1 output domain-containing protein [Haladaptatus caseinilyticus]|uniref:HalOD1 output domain-containing protein n=1 Tax=Haladaptatus caseinilyticus TaxID=2993314 RepID=UPI00224B0987|nr:HalOD1 output domain-containing protein [Haladaptatus caseinilyticus]